MQTKGIKESKRAEAMETQVYLGNSVVPGDTSGKRER